ncbi:MAG TPA: class I SAM-dependent methyltransferase [Acidobacteriota bacterium]|nr:class I SAM-dependent methyltransferase [Acidobacteriota bacterium]
MTNRVCPWWLGYFLINPLRRLWYKPETILRPFVTEGMLVLEPGCGMGYFTLDIARLVGPHGRVVAIDLQPRMLTGLQRRARKAGVAGRIDARLAERDMLGVDDLAGAVDFALVFAVVHELPDQRRFFLEMHQALKAGGKILIAEPKGHVTESKFRASLEAAATLGFQLKEAPVIGGSRTAVLERS